MEQTIEQLREEVDKCYLSDEDFDIIMNKERFTYGEHILGFRSICVNLSPIIPEKPLTINDIIPCEYKYAERKG